jgi:SH3-like domain-containing protein
MRGTVRIIADAMHIDSRTLLRAVALVCALLPQFAEAAEPAPHYVSLRRDQGFLREGPGYSYRILWVYQHKDYPLEVVASFDAWRRVKDVDGTVGWMHRTQLSDRRTVLFVGFVKSPLRDDDDPASKIVAYAAPGVVAHLKACKPRVCEVEAGDTDGWVDRRNIWGVGVDEVVQ